MFGWLMAIGGFGLLILIGLGMLSNTDRGLITTLVLALLFFIVFIIGVIWAIINAYNNPDHYRIQYVDVSGEVITVDDAVNLQHDKSGIVYYVVDGEEYQIKSSCIEIKKKEK